MLKALKKMTIQMVVGANIATIIVMFLVGFSDYISPASHPFLACIGLSFPIFLIINLFFFIFWLIFHPHKAWIPLLGYLICIVPLRQYFPINWRSEPPKGAIKILSYNVLAFALPTMDSLGRYPILEYIKNSDADVVCLQESLLCGNLSKAQVDSVLNAYPYNDTTIVGYTLSNCVALYSRFPILSKEKIKFSSAGNGSVAYRLKIGRDTVLLINNHLESNKLSYHDRALYKNMIKGMKRDTVRTESKRLIVKLGEALAIRARQAEAINRYIRLHQGQSIILCGDFNDNPISYTHRLIAKPLKDCYVRSGCGPGLSYNEKGFNVRIDNIMCSDDWESYNCRVDNKIDASDHYPIYCWLKKK